MVSSFFKSALTALILGASHAAKIVDWNKSNVEVGTANNPGEIVSSIVYTSLAKTDTYGGVLWEEGNVESPGMKVVTDGDGDESCIMTSGFNPEDNTDKQCNDPRQTSKRAKVYTNDLEGPVDLVFNVSTAIPIDSTYRFFLKYENLSPSRIESFTIQLGKGIGDEFVPSVADDGIAFATRDGTEILEQANIDSYSDNSLGVVFAFGLFGNASESWHSTDGYYDPTKRGRFNMTVESEDVIKAFPVTDNIADLYNGAMKSWINKGIAPQGYAYDNDGDPETEAVLVADFDAAGKRLADSPFVLG